MFARMIKSFVNTPGMLSGLAWRQPFFMALTGGYPVLAGSLLLTIAGPPAERKSHGK